MTIETIGSGSVGKTLRTGKQQNVTSKTGFYSVKAQKVSIQVILGLGFWFAHPSAFAQTPPSDVIVTVSAPIELERGEQILSVEQLSDVLPVSRSFVALQFLVERYGCLSGDRELQFSDDRPLSRYEFAVAIETCLDNIRSTQTINELSPEDLATVQQLQTDFAVELTNLQSRAGAIDARLTALEPQQFSTTSRLSGQAIFAVNAGGFAGDRIISPRGATVTRDQPNPTLLYRLSLDINTSFSGNDLLKLRLLAGSAGAGDNAAGFLEPNLGSTLDFAVPGTETLSAARLYYTFTPVTDLSVTVGARMVASDFVDKNQYANVGFRDFSTQALVNNFLLLPRPGGAGGAIDWHPDQGAFSLRAAYIASSAADNLPENQQLFGGGGVNDVRLFPVGGGGAEGGLFGDPYLAVAELEYGPTDSLTVRLQYSRGEVLGSNFQTLGANFDWAMTPKIGIFGRYGYASYPDTTVGDIRPSYWSAGISFQDLFTEGDLAGVGIAQPFIVTEIGNSTQTNLEAFYNIPLNQNIRITPLIQVIDNAANQSSNREIIVGTIRTVFTF